MDQFWEKSEFRLISDDKIKFADFDGVFPTRCQVNLTQPCRQPFNYVCVSVLNMIDACTKLCMRQCVEHD